MEERELVSLIEQQVASSIGHWGAGWGISGTGLQTPVTRQSLAEQRALALDYYESNPFGNEVEGESQVVSSDVFDTVEGMLPSLLRIFTASDDVVRFDPNGPEDEEAAQQQTEVCNYIFYRQNNGFLILYEWFKDALIQNNGIVKYWWEEKTVKTKSEYRGLSENQYRKLLKSDGKNEVEELEHTVYDDETAIEQRDAQLLQVEQQAKQRGVPPEQVEQLKAQVLSQPIPQLHDVTVRIIKDASRVCIETVPPEEFGITPQHKCVSIQDTSFCFQKRTMTISELREMGCPDEVLERAGSAASDGTELQTNIEVMARERFIDQVVAIPPAPQESMREILVTDCFLKVDMDGDGIDELRHIIKVGQAIWTNEETDHINFACITPIIMPHTWVGMSVAELVMNDQFTKSVIWRQMLNNLYLTNNPRKAVLSSPSGVVQANLDDLMSSRAGGIYREYVPNAVRLDETPFVAGAAFPMLEYIDAQKEVRTGVTRYSQGTDADSLNKTARGIQMIQQAGQQRGDLVARIFAETGVKDLMRGIVYMLSKYASKPMTVRLRNKWVEIDPREWKTQFDMTVNVGLGTGNKDIQLAHLQAMHQSQVELMQEGRGYMVTDENVWNLHRKRSEAMGFKHPEIFVSDPATVQKPPPQPNPDLIKIQAETKTDEAKLKSNEQIRLFDAQTQKELEGIKSQTQIAIAQLNAATQKEIAQLKISADGQLEIFKANKPQDQSQLEADVAIERFKADNAAQIKQIELASNERIATLEANLEQWKADLDARTKVEVANISAKAAAKKAEKRPQV